MKTAIKYDRVEIRLPGNQKIFNPKLSKYQKGIALKYETQNNGIVYQHFKPVFPWILNNIHILSDRPNAFTLPGGKLCILSIEKNGVCKVEK